MISRFFFLYLEPTIEEKNGAALNDEYTALMRMALQDAKLGKSNFKEPGLPEPTFKIGGKHRGTYKNCDGVESSQQDFLLRNGMITNSLCVHYLMWFRMAIPKTDWDKIKELQKIYGRSNAPADIMFNNRNKFM